MCSAIEAADAAQRFAPAFAGRCRPRPRRTSSSVIRPCGPVPSTVSRSTSSSCAIRADQRRCADASSSRRPVSVPVSVPAWLSLCLSGASQRVSVPVVAGRRRAPSSPITTSTVPTGTDVALGDQDSRDLAARRRGDLDRRLVRSAPRRAGRPRRSPALGDQPAGDLALGQALAEVRQLELVGHGGGIYRGRPTQASRGTISTRSPDSTRARARSPARRPSARPRPPRHVAKPAATGPRSRSRRRSDRARCPAPAREPAGGRGRTTRRATRIRPVRHPGDRHDADPRVLPAHRLAGRRVSQMEPRPSPLQDQAQLARSEHPLPGRVIRLQLDVARELPCKQREDDRVVLPRLPVGPWKTPRAIPSSAYPSLRGIARLRRVRRVDANLDPLDLADLEADPRQRRSGLRPEPSPTRLALIQ